jgi:hypothetical protein
VTFLERVEAAVRTYGRHIEHDIESRRFPAETAPLRSVTHQHYGAVLDQGQLGSCTGNAAAQAMNTAPLYDGKRRLLTEQDAVAIYSWATHHDSCAGVYPPDDTGSSGLAVAKALKKLGLITGYHHAFGLDHTLGALILGPVIIGTAWTERMETPDTNGTIHYSPEDAVVGGHETCLVGIDVERRRVRGLNSWSTAWGDGGFYWLSFDDLGALLADRGDATVLIPAQAPPAVALEAA